MQDHIWNHAMPAPLSVMLVDSQALLRHGVAALIDAEPDMEVVAQADGAADLADLCDRYRPDVVSIELALLDPQPAEAIQMLRHACGKPKVIILTHRSSEEDVYRAMCAGANAYMFKDSSPDELLHCLRVVRAGGTFVPPPVAAKLAARLNGGTLSPREMQILERVAAGQSNKLIGRAFGISDGTVKSHTKRIFSKLGVSNRTGAVATAVQRGLIAL
jgi:two-component system NarL family response regulator